MFVLRDVCQILFLIGAAVLLRPTASTFILNTTCHNVSIHLSTDSDVFSLTFAGGSTFTLTLSSFLEQNHLTLYRSTEFSRDELSFHQIGVGSRVTHELGIEVHRSDNVTWKIRFDGDRPEFSGYYEIDIGGCRTENNITILTPIKQEAGYQFNLTVPEIAIQSLSLTCPFILSFFSLRIFFNGSEIRDANVYFDSPREILTISPYQLDPSLAPPDLYTYNCIGANEIGFNDVFIQLSISPSNSSNALTRSVREGDRIHFDLEAICQPFYSQFFSISKDKDNNSTSTPPSMRFTLNGESISERNLSLARLDYNGSFSCHVEHTVYVAQTEILDLLVKPLNACAHSNGGCEHTCSTFLGADSFNCSCRPGYQLTSNQLTCEDINECLSAALHSCVSPSQRCENQPEGSYSCECAQGFLPSPADQRCEDVDECELEADVCMHECTNSPGAYSCSCRPGYTLLPVDNSTCIGTPLETPSFLITPVILATIFGVVLLLSIAVILLLVVAVCKRNRSPTRLKYEMFTKRLSGDFKCHQQVDNPVFRLDQSSLFRKRISPRKNVYGALRDVDVPDEPGREYRPRSSNYRPRSLEQAALSDGGLTAETDDLSDDVMLPKPLSTRRSPTIVRHDSAQKKDNSPPHRPTKVLPHSNMVPVLPLTGEQFPFRNLKSRTDSPAKSARDSQTLNSSEQKIDNTFC